MDATTADSPGIGHNSDQVGVAVERLRSIVERVERLNADRAALGDDIKEIFAEAKSGGFDVKIVRKVIALRKRDPKKLEEEEILLDTYCRALGF